MLQLVEFKNSIDYLNLLQKLVPIKPNDMALQAVLSQVLSLESGCRCNRTGRYNQARNKINFYVSNLSEEDLLFLKKEYDTESLIFKDLVMY